ncbi:hypothetical protein NDI52_28935 [Leptolyngbya sp. PL-A3]|uniref:hypothetical protein n=1 Tax=Leptolyngbya sp. PL-A3 TaxID=2933911 RepID=UPI0032985504
MSIEEIQRQLTECDRVTLEYHYSFTELLVRQQRLVGYKASMLAQFPLPKETESNFQLIDQYLMRANEALEDIRRKIRNCSNLRCNIEHLQD